MKVAIVHDYLVDRGGAERVVEVMHEAFPQAPIYTSVFNPASTWPSFAWMEVKTSFLQKITSSKRLYKLMLPLYPLAFESLDLRGYEVVLSSTTSFAKGVITDPETCHICYCNTPTRFIWMYHEHRERQPLGSVVGKLLPVVNHYLRAWDYQAAQRVDYFVAGSHNAARRIKKFYRRGAQVLHSPIDASRFAASAKVEDYFLVVARLVPYKRIGMAVEAFNRLGLGLKVVGDGPDARRLRAMARSNVEFLGRVPDEALLALYGRCLGLVMPGEEDFGLTVLEANASGRPVIAYARGGALETVEDGVTGRLFHEASPEGLARAIKEFDPGAYDPMKLISHAMNYDKERFIKELHRLVEVNSLDHRARLGEKA